MQVLLLQPTCHIGLDLDRDPCLGLCLGLGLALDLEWDPVRRTVHLRALLLRALFLVLLRFLDLAQGWDQRVLDLESAPVLLLDLFLCLLLVPGWDPWAPHPDPGLDLSLGSGLVPVPVPVLNFNLLLQPGFVDLHHCLDNLLRIDVVLYPADHLPPVPDLNLEFHRDIVLDLNRDAKPNIMHDIEIDSQAPNPHPAHTSGPNAIGATDMALASTAGSSDAITTSDLAEAVAEVAKS
ncbi:hypothetical protein QBC37DRAFT_380232 [Rhypophila decipiens]|uniref:Uncharacterized protein n=1 Tax=Rhypophila decipiens TaxID=261697 RepID=A0AAN6XX51_9PEZI|nr:hypothetical protein QBC37DRAFT_380232 [Rhypophila decipiens]